MKSTRISAALLSAALLLAAASCAPARTASDASREAARTEYRDRLRIDSIRIHTRDSIHIRERADTVFVEKFRTQILYRERLRIDTANLTDTLRVTLRETVTEEVNRLTGWQHFQIWLGRIAAALIAAYVAFKRLFK